MSSEKRENSVLFSLRELRQIEENRVQAPLNHATEHLDDRSKAPGAQG